MKQFRGNFKRVTIVILSLTFALAVSAFAYMQHPKFGNTPSGTRLERIKQSPNYKDGKFQNATETPTFAEGHTFWQELRKSLFNKYPHQVPEDIIPSVKTDLINLPIDSAVAIWFGHSSCFIQANGKRILVDPVFSKNASPVPGSVKAFEGTTTYFTSDMPEIDYLLITHDHYDHLDYETVSALRDKTKTVICGLGVGAHFEHWGYSNENIIEGDWNEKLEFDSSAIYVLPARHKSGRGLKQNKTLWVSFLIQTPETKIYISGDGGYDKHFKAIGDEFGSIDLAIMENGQYDSAWHYVHLLPQETLKAAMDLQAKRVLPVHNSKFVLARHPWNDPLTKITEADNSGSVAILTPMIGELINLRGSHTFSKWWKEVQ
jgi:L-ascorbate metabolism protein UlaG (beta-lactamase superfamily)